jgi:MarR family transcriptional regulator for hemolysin
MELIKYDFENSVGAWLSWSSRAMERELGRELAIHGITPQQWGVLSMLVRSGPQHQAALAEALRMEPPTLCRMVDNMERDGWVVRTDDPADRRRKLIRLEPRAEVVWEKMVRSARKVRERATRDFTPEEVEQLRTLLARLRNNLKHTDTGV